ncbi:uncharacterized protein C8R40DRAFT_427171 [Lentinula edodes]|uniref:uncharacterized protein n=1 Tax=Lentinula edodes TaxID=5353 RepID=UPI001E8ECDE0|nr:uncharacterized protein C8R40DRAFT_427171 [Lentinula edodes]KAH7879491.1 hypothetical protein C8R40DRAFT_427171 [Lentinula edodes]
MFSLRSWYFIIFFVLVRCRCESATLESKDVTGLDFYGGEKSPVPAKRNDLTGVTQLLRRATSNSDSTAFAILTGCVAGILILLVLFVFIWTRLKRRRILDVEKGVVSSDTEVPSSIPPSKSSLKLSPRSSSNRSSWAFLQLRFARRKLWDSIEKESPKAYPYPFPDPDGTTGPEHQSSVAHPRTSREKNMPCTVLLPVEGGVLSVPASMAHETDDDEMVTHSNRREKPRQGHSPTDSLSRSPTRSRKGSLLSGPPLTVQQLTPTSPTEENSVDIASYYASAHTSGQTLEEELSRMLSEQEETQRNQ